jgi:hypothetical protein
MATKGKELMFLNELRTRAQHGDLDSTVGSRSPITQKDTETVFRTATELLQLLNA